MNEDNDKLRDPQKMLMAADLDRIEKEMKVLHRYVEVCNEKVDVGNDIARDAKKQIDQTNQSVDKILVLLTGNDLDESDNGVLGDMRNLKARVSKLEKRLDKAFYIIIGFSLATGWALSDILTKFFKP